MARVASRDVTPTSSAAPRTPSAVDAIADAHFDAVIALSPLTATYLGIPGADDQLDDFSEGGLAAQADLARATLARLDAAAPVDEVDAVTIAASLT